MIRILDLIILSSFDVWLFLSEKHISEAWLSRYSDENNIERNKKNVFQCFYMKTTTFVQINKFSYVRPYRLNLAVRFVCAFFSCWFVCLCGNEIFVLITARLTLHFYSLSSFSIILRYAVGRWRSIFWVWFSFSGNSCVCRQNSRRRQKFGRSVDSIVHFSFSQIHFKYLMRLCRFNMFSTIQWKFQVFSCFLWKSELTFAKW